MDITILIDTREKNYSHIEAYFKKRNIKYRKEKLDYGDYSVEVDGISLKEVIFIERKASIDELCGNFCKGRERFRREFERSKGIGFLMLEDCCYEDIIDGNYISNMKEKSLLGSLNSFICDYDIRTSFVKKRAAGNFIYYILETYAKKYMKNFNQLEVR